MGNKLAISTNCHAESRWLESHFSKTRITSFPQPRDKTYGEKASNHSSMLWKHPELHQAIEPQQHALAHIPIGHFPNHPERAELTCAIWTPASTVFGTYPTSLKRHLLLQLANISLIACKYERTSPPPPTWSWVSRFQVIGI